MSTYNHNQRNNQHQQGSNPMTTTERSHVSLERKLCKVCVSDFETNAILLDKHLRPSLERTTLTGWGLCPACQDLHDKGYVAIVGVSNAYREGQTVLTPSSAKRTGDIAHLRRSAWQQVFNSPVPADADGELLPLVFASDDVITLIKDMDERSAEPLDFSKEDTATNTATSRILASVGNALLWLVAVGLGSGVLALVLINWISGCDPSQPSACILVPWVTAEETP